MALGSRGTLRPGPQAAVAATPARLPGSVRRTTSLDMTRPGGFAGPVVADVRGQDVRTARDNDGDRGGEVVDRLALSLTIDGRSGAITAVDATAGATEADGLVGGNARSGFGRHLAALLPHEAAARSLRYSALDDLGGAFLVGGYSLLRGGAIPADPVRGEAAARAQADICSGWAADGPLLASLAGDGRSAIPFGPDAPAIEGDDPLGWHPLAPLAPGTVRRRRRVDVIPAGDGALLVHSHFRDSYAADDEHGHAEMVMHEYEVEAHVEVAADGARRLARVLVHPRVLPWGECPGAVASAQRLVGVAVDDIPARVRRDLVGPTTCTHLNSTLRCLADVRALASD